MRGLAGSRVALEALLSSCAIALGLSTLLAITRNYLLFHTLVEVFSVVVAWSVFGIFWNARRLLNTGFYLFIGIGYLFVGLVDLLHTLAYQGMGVFAVSGANLATQYWIAGRFLQSTALLIAPMFLRRRLEPFRVMACYAVVTAVLVAMIGEWGVFPVCFDEATGLTPFKIWSEYAVSGILLAALGLLCLRRRELDRRVFVLLAVSIAATIAAELVFTLYDSPFGWANFGGHLLRLFAFYLTYKAFVEVGLTQPFSLLLREVKRDEEALRTIDRRKDDFLTMLAHEMRNWLAPVRSAVDLLGRRELDEAQTREAADVIRRQLEHITRLVDDLGDVSRIARGKLELKRRRMDLAAVVGQAIDASRPWIDRRRHRLEVEMDHEPVYVEGDADRLTQVFTNLLNNAAKYTEPGGRITVRLRREDDQAVVRVEDNGMGLAPEARASIFSPFVQAGKSSGESQGGMGVGLALVKSLVNMHRGTVEAASAGPGRGSQFEVRLPALPGPRLAAPDRPSPAPLASRAPARGECDVLLVEDHTDAARTLSLLLEDLGHRVVTAADGPGALEAARSGRPQVVLLDIGLPGMNGFEVAQRLRREHGSGLRLVAMTGFREEDDAERFRQAGFDEHFLKPVKLEALAALLERLAHQQPATTETGG